MCELMDIRTLMIIFLLIFIMGMVTGIRLVRPTFG